MKADQAIRWIVLVAALTSTAYAEHHLGVWIGWNPWVAAVIPAVSDLYLIYATRTGRDIVPSVSVVIGLSAANYICTAPVDPVRTSLSVAVSALAPLVLWRLHANHNQQVEPTSPVVLAEPEPEPEPEHTSDHFADARKVTAPEPKTARLSDAEALRMAEHAYVNGVKAPDAAESVTRSVATVYRMYTKFKQEGVKQLTHS